MTIMLKNDQSVSFRRRQTAFGNAAKQKCPASPGNKLICGERGIRTPGTFDSTPVFETGTLNRSDISPDDVYG